MRTMAQDVGYTPWTRFPMKKSKNRSGRKRRGSIRAEAELRNAIAVSASALNVSEQAVRRAWERAGLLIKDAKDVLKPSELWKNRDRSAAEKAPAFLKRVYAPWIGRGLTMLALRHADFALYQSIAAHKSRGKLDIDLSMADGHRKVRKRTRAKTKRWRRTL